MLSEAENSIKRPTILLIGSIKMSESYQYLQAMSHAQASDLEAVVGGGTV